MIKVRELTDWWIRRIRWIRRFAGIDGFEGLTDSNYGLILCYRDSAVKRKYKKTASCPYARAVPMHLKPTLDSKSTRSTRKTNPSPRSSFVGRGRKKVILLG